MVNIGNIFLDKPRVKVVPCVGIDSSLTSIGYTFIDSKGDVFIDYLQPETPKVKSVGDYILNLKSFDGTGVGLVSVEDFTFQSSFSSIQIAMAFGSLLFSLQTHLPNIDMLMVHPSRVKNIVGEKKGEKKEKSKEFLLKYFPDAFELLNGGKRVSQRVQGDVSDSFAICLLGFLTELHRKYTHDEVLTMVPYGIPEFVYKGENSLLQRITQPCRLY